MTPPQKPHDACKSPKVMSLHSPTSPLLASPTSLPSEPPWTLMVSSLSTAHAYPRMETL